MAEELTQEQLHDLLYKWVSLNPPAMIIYTYRDGTEEYPTATETTSFVAGATTSPKVPDEVPH